MTDALLNRHSRPYFPFNGALDKENYSIYLNTKKEMCRMEFKKTVVKLFYILPIADSIRIFICFFFLEIHTEQNKTKTNT